MNIANNLIMPVHYHTVSYTESREGVPQLSFSLEDTMKESCKKVKLHEANDT